MRPAIAQPCLDVYQRVPCRAPSRRSRLVAFVEPSLIGDQLCEMLVRDNDAWIIRLQVEAVLMRMIQQPLQLAFGFELRVARLMDIREGNGQGV